MSDVVKSKLKKILLRDLSNMCVWMIDSKDAHKTNSYCRIRRKEYESDSAFYTMLIQENYFPKLPLPIFS